MTYSSKSLYIVGLKDSDFMEATMQELAIRVRQKMRNEPNHDNNEEQKPGYIRVLAEVIRQAKLRLAAHETT
jgi:hypothetical protein